MAKAATFHVGSSGSGKHTETYGDGSGMGVDRRGGETQSTGPGPMGNKVKSIYGNTSKSKAGGKMSRYSEE